MHRCLIALLLLIVGTTAAQAHEVLDRLDQCIARLDQNLDVGYERIAARCPELAPALMQSPWATWLPADWNQPKNQLSAQGLTELRTLLARERVPRALPRAPRPERAGGVLARIAQPDNPQLGWWQHLKRWLRDLITPRPQGNAEPLAVWLSGLDFARGAGKVIVWIALALVTATAGAILINELRIAGVLKPRRPAIRGNARADTSRPGTSLGKVEGAGPLEKPALLLELIAARLTEQDRLPPARALTAQELVRGARLPGESDRTQLAELAAVCEQVRFSARSLAGTTLASAVAAGRRVLAVLESRAAPVPAPGPPGA